MKNLIVITAVLLIAGCTSGQTLQKGSVVCIHTWTYTLNPDVSMNQFLAFLQNKYIPEINKNSTDSKMYLLEGDRGEKKNQIAFMTVFASVQARDKYYPTPDKTSPELDAIIAKLKPVTDEMAKFVVEFKDVYTDWVVK